MSYPDYTLDAARQWAKENPERAEYYHDGCTQRLSFTPEDIAGYRRRQEILIAHPKWPLQNWYHDEDFCRAMNTAIALHEQLAAVEAERELDAENESCRQALEAIREAWKKWRHMRVPDHHKQTCSYLCGSRPEYSDCECGLVAAKRRRDKAFDDLVTALDERWEKKP